MKNIKPTCSGLFECINDIPKNEIINVSLGNGTAFDVILNVINGYLWVSIINRGCYGFADFAHHSYVNSKLNINNESDAKHMADFINDQLGLNEARQGTYHKPLLNHFQSTMTSDFNVSLN